MRTFFSSVLILGGVLILFGCHNMEDQPKVEVFEHSQFFENGLSARTPVEGTVARGQLREDDHLYRGEINGEFANSYPFPIDEKTLRRGRERFNIYCAICHNETGVGDGMIVRRGYKQPPSLHEERLREVPEGYLFDVITHGMGDMPRYAAELTPEERWAVIAYIRTLQQSQRVPASQLSPDELKKVKDEA